MKVSPPKANAVQRVEYRRLCPFRVCVCVCGAVCVTRHSCYPNPNQKTTTEQPATCTKNITSKTRFPFRSFSVFAAVQTFRGAHEKKTVGRISFKPTPARLDQLVLSRVASQRAAPQLRLSRPIFHASTTNSCALAFIY